MAEEVATVTGPTKKEPEVLLDSSLILLARHLALEKMNYLVFGMRLNMPTTTLVNIQNGFSDAGMQDDPLRTAVAEKTILLWKKQTADAKTKDRIKCIEKALRDMDKSEIADMFVERHAQNQEITSDCF